MKDYYVLLGVKPNASLEQIDAAYRQLMQKHHPNARSSPQMLERLRELNLAWRVLSDPTQRAAYDRARAQGLPFQPPNVTLSPRPAALPTVNEFGATHNRGGSCLVRLAVALVFLFAVGILLWGLNQQLNFGAWWQDTQRDVSAYLFPNNSNKHASLPGTEVPPTPDPRCRNGCETPPPGCVVKGKLEAGGARFFYLPNDAGYNTIRLDIANGDRWFCAASNALAEGWTRKAPTETPQPTLPPEAFTTATARKNLVVCADNAALYQGPGQDFPLLQNMEMGARVIVTGINGDWAVLNTDIGAVYIRADALCTPTRVPATARAASPDANVTTLAPANSTAPIANAASANFKYGAPHLAAPTNGARYWCSRDLMFEWSFDGALAADEFFLVESKPHEQGKWTALAAWTKEPRIALHPNRGGGSCDTVWWSNTGAYQWRVSVVRGNPETPEYLSPFSEINDIIYAQ